MMRRLSLLPESFRGRFLLVVFGAALVPLALIGVWLTQSVVGAGRDLLRSELDQSLETISAEVAKRWSYRRGDLELLARNEAATRVLNGEGSAAPSPEEAAYFAELFASVSRTIPAFEYRDAAGGVRWASPPPPMDRTDDVPSAEMLDTLGRRATASSGGTSAGNGGVRVTDPTVTVPLPVVSAATGVRLGEVIAQVSIAALMPVDTSVRLPSGARLQWVERATGLSVLPTFAPDALLTRDRFTAVAVDWLAVHRTLADPEIDLILAAPLDAYVQPFARVARTGVLVLIVVALLAFTLSAFLTTRLTGSLERLAVAADAVAGGDLAHRVDGGGAAEVQRVAGAFNSMTESLRRTLAELSTRQALAATGEFAASLSHEVRNGLTAIRVDLQRAEDKIGTDAPSRPLIARALENVRRLDDTVTGSLQAARSSHRSRRRLDLGSVAEAAVQSAEGTFAERGVTVSTSANASARPWVLGDALALEQLMLNLLLNAAQAMAPGGRASLVVDIDGADVRVLVTDSGAGIATEDLPHVLDPFFSTKPHGTGLGLPIARQIAAAHGGSLKIESVPGDGTRVEVRLPLAAAPS
jgi:two-component system sensor histidine kinase AtoS